MKRRRLRAALDTYRHGPPPTTRVTYTMTPTKGFRRCYGRFSSSSSSSS